MSAQGRLAEHVHAPGHRRTTSRGLPGTALAVTLGLVAVNAVYGGVGLMVNGLGMSPDWLDNMPTHSWTLGGIALLATVAVPQAAVLAGVVRGQPHAPAAGVAAGLALVGWIVVQVGVLQRFFVLQPVVAAFGLVEVGLALWWRARLSAALPSEQPA